MGDEDEDGAAERLVVDAERWLADARIDQAARARSRERWLRQQSDEDATFAGLLAALADNASNVELTFVTADRVEGALVGLGADYLVLATADATITYVALSAVASVRETGRGHEAADEATRQPSRLLWQIIALEAAERPDVEVRCGSSRVRGTLTSAGADVLTVAVEGPKKSAAYVPLASVTAVSLRSSG